LRDDVADTDGHWYDDQNEVSHEKLLAMVQQQLEQAENDVECRERIGCSGPLRVVRWCIAKDLQSVDFEVSLDVYITCSEVNEATQRKHEILTSVTLWTAHCGWYD
jgi:hypothetical protein